MQEARSGAGGRFGSARRARRALAAGLGAASALGAIALAADSMPPPGFNMSLPLSGGYVLEVDGRPDPSARFFEGEPPVQVVVMSSQGPGWVLDRQTQSVRRLMARLVMEDPAGSITLLPGAAAETLSGGYQAEGSGVKFSDANHSYVVSLKPALVGEVTLEQILTHSPEYRVGMSQYTPSAAAVEQIRHCSPTARIELFFGSWCPHCRRRVPLLLRSLEMAKGSPLSVRIVGLPRGFAQEKAAAERGIQRIPTLIVFDGLREVGRVQGEDWEHPEVALARLLPGAPKAASPSKN